MTDPDCSLCRGVRWVCEEHSSQPWGHVGCKGAGVPCPACNPAGPDEPPASPRGLRDIAGLSPHARNLCLPESPGQFYHQAIIRLAMVMVATTPSELMMTGGPQVARSISDRAAKECVSCEDATPKIEN
jgi:hypothetical protein